MKNKITLEGLIDKYNLRDKSIEELERIIGDSDRDCLTILEYDFLKGSTYIYKARNLKTYLDKQLWYTLKE